jgi:dsRNA-specific ribonuclease
MDDLNEAEKMMRLELGELVNQEVKTAIIKKKFPRMAEEEVEKLINDMKQTETTASQGLSGSILNRVPSFNRFSAAGNANSGGK